MKVPERFHDWMARNKFKWVDIWMMAVCFAAVIVILFFIPGGFRG